MAQIKLIVEGGSMKPGPAVAQQLGPMGINLGKVIEDTNEATAGFKGMKVPVIIDVDAKTKSYTITVSSPPISELIKKELKLEKGSAKAGSIFLGNLSIEQIISVAKTKMSGMLAKELKSAVKLTLGSCVALGVFIESKSPKQVSAEVDEGVYDSQISQSKTDTSPEKRKELDAFFEQVRARQEAQLKAEELKAKEAEEKAAK